MSPSYPRTVIVGAGGQLGRALARLLPHARALRSSDVDITSANSVGQLDLTDIDLLINAAAYTAVDKAETDRATAWAVNATGVANLAHAAANTDTGFIHVSTEYVFDGASTRPIAVDAPVSPLSVYGASKAAGEIAATIALRHWTVRTSWVVGDGGNFVRTMAGLAEQGIDPSVVSDQIGRPTFADDLAGGLIELVDHAPGTYHLTNNGDSVSWADLAREVFRLTGHDPGRIKSVTTADYFAGKPDAAPRPLNSVLDLGHAASVGVSLPDWRESLRSHLEGDSF